MNALSILRAAAAAATLAAAAAHAQSGQVLAPTSGPIAGITERAAAHWPSPRPR